MAANMWKNILKNLEFDNNKIFLRNFTRIFFHSETVLTDLNKPRILYWAGSAF